MRIAIPLAVMAVLAAGSLQATPDMLQIKPGEPFSLRVGERAALPEPAWQIRLEAVIRDSRCPKKVHCVWAGDATVRLSKQGPASAPETVELNLSDGSKPGPGLRLIELEPYPVAGRSVAPSDYRATLIIGGAASTAPTQ